MAFSGSNSSRSINQQLVHIAAAMLHKTEVEILNIRDYPAPVYGIDREEQDGFPESMKAFNDKLLSADAFIVASPEHNGSMPAAFKNTLDWVSRMGGKIFKEKPTVFLSTSQGKRGGASVLDHLLTIMPYRGAQIVGGYALGSFDEKVKNGQLIEGEDKKAIEALIRKLEDELSS